jgi:outer membrane protein
MTEETNQVDVTPEVEHKKDNQFLYAIILGSLGFILGLVALIYALTLSPSGNSGQTAKASGNLTFAWINTDTIMSQYEFAKDLQKGLEEYEKNLQNKYTSELQAFQNEYNAYIKKASDYQMTLDQQKKKEEELGQKQQQIQQLEAELSQMLMNEKTARNMELHDTIVNYIARYNKNKNYTMIFERTYGGGLLWADSTMDVTPEVLKGLNEEYVAIKKEKEKTQPKGE